MVLHARFRWILGCAALTTLFAGSGGATQPLDSIIEDDIQDQIEDELATALLDQLEESVESEIEQALEGELADTLGTIEGATRAPLGGVREVLPGATERFVPAVDPEGRTIERGVWVILAPPRQLARLERQGLVVRELRRLESMGLVLIRAEAPVDQELAETALRFGRQMPGTRVDYNHVYRNDSGRRAGPARPGDAGEVDRRPQAGVAVGMIDSSVNADHESLRNATIVLQDFVPFAQPRPAAHGTAVASILVGDSDGARGLLPGARLFAASVFFQDATGASAATTASLVSALDWVVASGARVVNMSLSGPPNRVLEAAMEQVAERDVVVVAAVGNDGPAAGPRYPAAYEGVVGVTAVDAGDRIYRYANRGPQVTFSAPGVDVPVASAGGGYGLESGTSMAAPHAAAIIARALARTPEAAGAVMTHLEAAALDLGEPGFDPTYGFGRIRD